MDSTRIEVMSTSPPSADKTASSAPPVQSMNDLTLINDEGTEAILCMPSAASCCLSIVFPCGWLGALQTVPERHELISLNFGKFNAVAREPGLYCINPCGTTSHLVKTAIETYNLPSLKVLDCHGSPLIVSGVITFKVYDTRLAALDVANYHEYIQQQSEVVLKQICAQYPYESKKAGEESLKGEQEQIRTQIVEMLQTRADRAGKLTLHCITLD
jgi:regulator of protease activity HflC (stomatin/prohibitin superfamily)